MARQTLKKLTEKEAKSLAKRPGRHGDGGGLALVVSSDGRARWVYRFTMGGKTRDMGLGAVRKDKDTGLEEARRQAAEAREKVRRGVDPLKAREAERKKTVAEAMTFGEMAEEVAASLKGGWRSTKHALQWEQSIRDHACRLRERSVASIDVTDVLAVLKPIWQKMPETASRVRGRIEKVLDAARSAGYIDEARANPARWKGHLEHLLSTRKKVPKAHFASMPYADVPAFLARLQQKEGNDSLALQLVILTGARSGEVLLARPAEFDLATNIWTIPANRMKAGAQHRVPLSPAAVEVVRRLMEQKEVWLVPGSKPKRPLGDAAMSRLLRAMSAGVTVHGFRSSFRTWADEVAHAQYEVAEACLAHTVGSAVSRAYARSDLLERRRTLMDAWANFCTTPPANNVVPITRTSN